MQLSEYLMANFEENGFDMIGNTLWIHSNRPDIRGLRQFLLFPDDIQKNICVFLYRSGQFHVIYRYSDPTIGKEILVTYDNDCWEVIESFAKCLDEEIFNEILFTKQFQTKYHDIDEEEFEDWFFN